MREGNGMNWIKVNVEVEPSQIKLTRLNGNTFTSTSNQLNEKLGDFLHDPDPTPSQQTLGEGEDQKLYGEWQLCPKCLGQGTVSKPPYLAGDIFHWSSNQTSFQCDVCNGSKIITRPPIKKI